MVNMKVAYQGDPGAYSELAALDFFGTSIESVPCHTFEDVFALVPENKCQYGLIPVENSLAGSIHHNYDLMLEHDLHIVGEYNLRVRHCLMALPDVPITDIQRVHSHPQALAQCDKNLKRLGVETVAEADTAGSASLIRVRGERHAGALASHRAAEVYDLVILSENMEDNPANYTRFLALARQPGLPHDKEQINFKTSIVFSLRNEPGALFKALSVFALRDIDLTKIESRPIQGQLWEYMFYIDFAGHAGDQNCSRALDHLAELAPYMRVLGSYPRHSK
jgi:prephenate dehydratase